MNEKIINYSNRIKIKLEKKKKSLHLDELLLKMEANNDVKNIRSEIDAKVSNIEVLQRFLNQESPEIKKIINEISILKAKLYEIKEVKKYNKALEKYNRYIDYINKEIFDI